SSLLSLLITLLSSFTILSPCGWTEKKCWNNTGRCRNQCKSTETDHSTCANKKRCCVPTDRVKIWPGFPQGYLKIAE
uniref:Beta-defensin n=1 Tax=Sarcophilus harrisii TaxID=9305 RepID=A0A7N4PZ10_SARHA